MLKDLLEVQLCQKQRTLPLLRELVYSIQDKNSVRSVSREESPSGTNEISLSPSPPTKHSQAPGL